MFKNIIMLCAFAVLALGFTGCKTTCGGHGHSHDGAACCGDDGKCCKEKCSKEKCDKEKCDKECKSDKKCCGKDGKCCKKAEEAKKCCGTDGKCCKKKKE